MKTIDDIFAESPAGSIQSTDRLVLQRVGTTVAAEAAALRSFISDSITVTYAQISDATALGRDLIKATDSATVRTTIGAAPTTHSHDLSDINGVGTAGKTLAEAETFDDAKDALEIGLEDITEYDPESGQESLNLTRINLDDLGPKDVPEEGDIWRNGDQLCYQGPDRSNVLANRIRPGRSIDEDDTIGPGDTGSVILVDTAAGPVNLELDFASVEFGDTILLVNTGGDSNDVVISAKSGSIIGPTSITDNSSLELTCVEPGAQIWLSR